MKPLRTSLYWRLLVWFCVANLLVLALGGLFARRFIEFTTSIEINWAALAQDADQAYESGGRDALAAWVAQQRQQGVEATLFEHGEMLYPIRLGASVRSQLPTLLSSDRSVVMQPRPSFYVAVQQGRHFVGIELKPSYWKTAVSNLEAVSSQMRIDLPESNPQTPKGEPLK